MNQLERVAAVLAGRQPDRPPVSFWCHFGPDAASGSRAVAAHVRHVEQYDLDFVKIMDDNRYPRGGLPGGVVATADDLARLRVLRGDEDSFGRQLWLVGELARRWRGRLFLTTTIFNSWTTLRYLTAPDAGVHGPPTLAGAANPSDATIARLLREAPQALAAALETIGHSLANFARHCLSAGADGVFLSVRDDWVGTPENGPRVYDELVRPTDLEILAAASGGTFNVLHVCGVARDFRRFAAYPVHIINWADRAAGPAIADVCSWVRPAICAGLDNLGAMASGSLEDCAAQVRDALAQAGGRPLLVAPGCTYDPAVVPAANLRAIRAAVGP